VLGFIEEFNNFSISESHVSNSLFLFSRITEVDPIPISKIIFIFDCFIGVNIIMSLSESEVIGREGEVTIRVQLDHKSSISENRGILLVFRFIDG
jgi:hypothetical protein